MDKTVQLRNGRQATYDVIGEGEPALLFEGGPGFAAGSILGEAELLSDRFACHVIDPHGSGGSSPPSDENDYDHEGHARFYDEVREFLRLDRVTVVGHSFGAVVALTYAAMFPERTERCIAISALAMGEEIDQAEGGEGADEMEAMISRHSGQPWYEDARKVWYEWTDRVLATDDPGEVEDMMRTVLPLYTAHPDRPDVAEKIEKLHSVLKVDLQATKVWENGLYQGIDIRPLLPKIQVPTLVVAGELDLICGPAHARVVADEVKGSQLALIGDCGHLVSLEAPDAFKDAVVRWLDA